MGNFNSGRHGGKRTTQGRNHLDVRRLQRDGLLLPGTRFESTWTRNGQANGGIRVWVNADRVRLIYRHGGDTGQDMDYPVMLSRTPCHYGGERVWWLCPCCGKRVAILYSGKVFSCRHCQQLAYASDRVAKSDKPYRRANKVRARLGWGGGVASPMGDKPKGMHWTTYLRLLTQLNQHSLAAIQGADVLVQRLMASCTVLAWRWGRGIESPELLISGKR